MRRRERGGLFGVCVLVVLQVDLKTVPAAVWAPHRLWRAGSHRLLHTECERQRGERRKVGAS